MTMKSNIARTPAHWEIAHFSMRWSFGADKNSSPFLADLHTALNLNASPVRSSKAQIYRVLTTHWSIHTWSTYICPSIAPSSLISVIIQQKHWPKRLGMTTMCEASFRSKNSYLCDVINGIPEWANQQAFSCHVTDDFGPPRQCQASPPKKEAVTIMRNSNISPPPVFHINTHSSWNNDWTISHKVWLSWDFTRLKAKWTLTAIPPSGILLTGFHTHESFLLYHL